MMKLTTKPPFKKNTMSCHVTMSTKQLPLLSRFSLDSCARLPSGAKAESAPCGLENLELANRSNMDLPVKGMLPSRHTSLGRSSFHKLSDLSGPHFATPNHTNTIASKTQLQATPAR